MNTQEIKNAIEALNLKYEAEFIPQKFSRNADNKNPSLNWRVTVSKDGKFITTDFTQGIGHIPNYNKMDRATQRYNATLTPNTMEYRLDDNSFRLKKLAKPELTDVLYSLTCDSDVCNYCGFEDWAETLGYGSDSISAKAIYEECQTISRQFKRIVNIEEMQELFSDY